LKGIGFRRRDALANDTSETLLVIESIAERLDVKQAFFRDAEKWFGDDAILCSNTSTLRIQAIAESLRRPERFCGMHFFMPVWQRHAVELVRGPLTSAATIEQCRQHAKRIAKRPLVVGDGPGFVVNRLLSPYLNEAMRMLTGGVSAEAIERAAKDFGMPMSPLELIDWIGIRTMFDAGRVYWQAFPNRLNPSPLLAGLVKRKRLGRTVGRGIYDYDGPTRSASIAEETIELVQRYFRSEENVAQDDVLMRLSIPMWIEGALALRDQIANGLTQLNQAMEGGLGFTTQHTWSEFYDHIGSDRLLDAIERWSPHSASLNPPPQLKSLLEQNRPSEAIVQFASSNAH